MKAERPYWSFSRLSGYSCSQLGYYQYERKLRKKGEPFFALKAGQDGHEALHLVLAEGVSPSDAVESVMGAEQVQGLFSQESDNITPHQMESIIQDYVDTVMGGPYRPVQLSADMMQMDKLVWPTPVEIEEILAKNGHLSELGVAVQWPGLNEAYGGIIDRLMQHQDTGHYEVWDTKFTTSPPTPYLGARWEGSFQMIGYVAIWRELTGLDIDVGKVEAIYIGGSKSHKFGSRHEYPVFNGWHGEMRDSLTTWVNNRVSEIKWRRETGIYSQVDGSWPSWRQKVCKSCDYKELCYARPSAREGLIRRDFEERESR